MVHGCCNALQWHWNNQVGRCTNVLQTLVHTRLTPPCHLQVDSQVTATLGSGQDQLEEEQLRRQRTSELESSRSALQPQMQPPVQFPSRICVKHMVIDRKSYPEFLQGKLQPPGPFYKFAEFCRPLSLFHLKAMDGLEWMQLPGVPLPQGVETQSHQISHRLKRWMDTWSKDPIIAALRSNNQLCTMTGGDVQEIHQDLLTSRVMAMAKAFCIEKFCDKGEETMLIAALNGHARNLLEVLTSDPIAKKLKARAGQHGSATTPKHDRRMCLKLLKAAAKTTDSTKSTPAREEITQNVD